MGKPLDFVADIYGVDLMNRGMLIDWVSWGHSSRGYSTSFPRASEIEVW